mgnify:CR=1 FL=1
MSFIGPTSVGKSSLYNRVFGLHLEEGLGSTTKEASLVKETDTTVFWDAPGINKDFGFYQPKHLGFFQSMSKVFILFDRDVDDVHFIIQVFATMKVPRVIVRTKCDQWKEGMKTVEEQLKIDLEEVRKYDPECKKVLCCGRGMD